MLRIDIKPNQIYYADLSPCVGNEIGGIRPCKIVEVYYDDLVRVRPKVLNTITMEYEYSEKHEKTISIKRLREKMRS